jgi:hypothetical protein
MQFGLFYEHQVPRPWSPEAERRVLLEALEQVALADRLGLEYVWEVEHHFLEEYSHSSAPEVFLAAASQRTTRIPYSQNIRTRFSAGGYATSHRRTSTCLPASRHRY